MILRLGYIAIRGKYWPKRAAGRRSVSVGLRGKITDTAKNVEFQQGIAVSWVSNNSPRASTSSYDVESNQYFMVSTWPGC